MKDYLSLITKFLFLFLLLDRTTANAQGHSSFKVGVIQSLTGIAAEDGKTVVRALELAKQDLASKGVAVELLIEDDRSSPKDAVTAYRKLRAQGIEIFIAATWDFTTNALMPLVGQDKVVLFNTSTLPESIRFEQAQGHAFTNAMSARSEARPFEAFLRQHSSTAAVIVYANNSWGETQRRIYRQIAESSGVKILSEYSSQGFDENDWKNILPAIKASAPNLVLLLINKNDLEMFLRRASEIGLSSRLFASKNAFDALRVTKQRQLYEELCFTYPLEQLQSHPEFNSRYQSEYGEQPRIYADTSYDALMILQQASLLAQASLKENLAQVELEGLVGPYKFSDRNSFSSGQASLICVENGLAVALRLGASSR
ncbi:MAG: hypothetical protein DCC75_02830 [Proteobacteria bacterium]|nr:MAG: hypothetical protein DCC75_02830 [Pseudomonadota bacterium]